jgi:two-component system response regulator DevR
MDEASEAPSGEPLTVCIVDDHPMVRDGLRAVFDTTDDIVVVGEADSLATALPLLRRVRPRVALVDVQLPDGSGTEICRFLKENAPEVSCLILTSMAHDEALFEAVRAGASGFVLKQIKSDELAMCVRRVAEGATLVDPRSARRLRERAEEGDADPLINSLSDQERRLLDLLAEGKTNREIATEMYLAEKTVKNYVSNLLMKMGMARRSEAAAHAARAEERRRLMQSGSSGDPIRF